MNLIKQILGFKDVPVPAAKEPARYEREVHPPLPAELKSQILSLKKEDIQDLGRYKYGFSCWANIGFKISGLSGMFYVSMMLYYHLFIDNIRYALDFETAAHLSKLSGFVDPR